MRACEGPHLYSNVFIGDYPVVLVGHEVVVLLLLVALAPNIRGRLGADLPTCIVVP